MRLKRRAVTTVLLLCLALTACGEVVVDYPSNRVEGTLVVQPGGFGTLEVRNTGNCLIREVEVTARYGSGLEITRRFVGDIPARQQRTYQHTISDGGGYRFGWSISEITVKRPYPLAPC